ncbi:hypothetical protein LZ30DRAFT_820831 [Colletotrichum cereale]|nr:hypothetical protein LZ30DRAFT_820831 [Colletotrichum cereale]
MLARGVLTSLAFQAFLTMTLASPTPKGDVTWTIAGQKEDVEALGPPGDALAALSKDMQAKTAAKVVAQADKPNVEGRTTADDLLMYYNV